MLKIDKISKIFDKGSLNEKEIFKDFSLEVKEGDFVTIIGSNGAGKSSLFNAIFGTFIPDEGHIYLDGEEITDVPSHKRARNIGYLFQDPRSGTAPNMTIEENLFLAGGDGGWLSVNQKKKTEEFVEKLKLLDMDLEKNLKKPVGLLSGGQRQALSLLMATYSKPKLLLLDEHTAALDPKTAEKVLALTDKIVNGEKLTCLMITHSMEMALNYGNRLIMMNDGKIIYDAEGEEKKNQTIDGLLKLFRDKDGAMMASDRMLLG